MKVSMLILTGSALVGLTTTAHAQSFAALLNATQEVAPGGATNNPNTGFAALTLNNLGGGQWTLDFSITFDADFDFEPVSVDASAGDPNVFGDPDFNNGTTEVTRLHIHNAARGSNGGVVFGILNPDADTDADTDITFNSDGTTTLSGQWDTGEGSNGADLNDFIGELISLSDGEDTSLYFNLHSADDPAGVIRGQIIAGTVPEPSTYAAIIGVLVLGFAAFRRMRGR